MAELSPIRFIKGSTSPLTVTTYRLPIFESRNGYAVGHYVIKGPDGSLWSEKSFVLKITSGQFNIDNSTGIPIGSVVSYIYVIL